MRNYDVDLICPAVEQLSHDSKFRGLNPATDGTRSTDIQRNRLLKSCCV